MVHKKAQEKKLSPEERVIFFFNLLIEIDRRKKNQEVQNENIKEMLYEA